MRIFQDDTFTFYKKSRLLMNRKTHNQSFIPQVFIMFLNFFTSRSTNASAESFNAKVKAFRAISRGGRDVEFFLFRLSKIYA